MKMLKAAREIGGLPALPKYEYPDGLFVTMGNEIQSKKGNHYLPLFDNITLTLKESHTEAICGRVMWPEDESEQEWVAKICSSPCEKAEQRAFWIRLVGRLSLVRLAQASAAGDPDASQAL